MCVHFALLSVPAGIWFSIRLGESSFIGTFHRPNPTTHRYQPKHPCHQRGMCGRFHVRNIVGLTCRMFCTYGAQNERFIKNLPRSAKPQTDTSVKSKVKGHWLKNSSMCVRESHRADLNVPNGEGIPWRFHDFLLCVSGRDPDLTVFV